MSLSGGITNILLHLTNIWGFYLGLSVICSLHQWRHDIRFPSGERCKNNRFLRIAFYKSSQIRQLDLLISPRSLSELDFSLSPWSQERGLSAMRAKGSPLDSHSFSVRALRVLAGW